MQRQLETVGRPFRLGASCCEVLDCRRNATGDGDARCLTRLALEAGRPLPPRPWWTAGPRGGLTATVVARPVRTDGRSLVVFEVDFPPGADHMLPERARSGGAPLEVLALGPLSVRAHGRSLAGDWLRQRPGQVLRYLIAARSGPERSESIANALWPERGPGAVANVRYSIFKLREHLGERGDPGDSLILRDSGGYRIDPRRLELDADAFASLTSSGVAAHRRGDDDATAERLLTEALALYRGDFLEEDAYVDWAFTEREYLRGLAGKGLAALAQISLSGGRLVAAADHLQNFARLEPFDSRVHQMLIEVCLRRGRRTEAMRHYHAFKQRLQRTFGEQPDFELTSITGELPAVGPHAAGGLARLDRRAGG
jgi:DNA-binding SARP family transcriptional activator